MSGELQSSLCVAFGRRAHFVLDGTAGRVSVSRPSRHHLVPRNDPCTTCNDGWRCPGADVPGCPSAEAWAWACREYQRAKEPADAG